MYTTCRVGVLSSEISKHSKISPPPSLRSHLTSSPMGVLSGDYGTAICLRESKTILQFEPANGSFVPETAHISTEPRRKVVNSGIASLLFGRIANLEVEPFQNLYR